MVIAAILTPAELWLVLVAVLVVLGISRLPGLVRTLRSSLRERRTETPRSAHGFPAEPAR